MHSGKKQQTVQAIINRSDNVKNKKDDSLRYCQGQISESYLSFTLFFVFNKLFPFNNFCPKVEGDEES